MPSQTTLYHLTLNSGHVARTARAEVDPVVLDLLRPLIDTTHGPIPALPGWYVDFMFPIRRSSGERLSGGAFFQITHEPDLSRRPVVMAVAAWSEAMTQGAWEQALLASALFLPTTAPQEPRTRPPIPWLAVWLTPIAAAPSAAPLLPLLGDLERCIAWALIDNGGTA